MASTVTLDELRELAGFRAEKGCAVSLYLNLDPSVTPTAGDVATRLNSLVTHLSRHVDDDTLGHRRKSLRADIERIREFVDDQFDRDGAHGVAIFASAADNLWRTLTTVDAVADIAKVNSELYIAPLVPLMGRSEGATVAVVSRERGELYRLRGGRLEELVDRSEPAPNQHDQGGWSQARYQRHVEHLVHAHLVLVAEELERRVRRSGGPVVMVGTEEMRAAFERTLSAEAREAIVGWAAAEAHAGAPELLTAASPVLEQWRAAEEDRTLDRWREEASRQGRAVAGWEPTLEAASDGRVALLLFRSGVQHSAWRCPKCVRVAAHDGSCPLDGTRMEQSEHGLDLAIHQTLSNGGAVRAVTARRDLDPVEGIGALLRY